MPSYFKGIGGMYHLMSVISNLDQVIHVCIGVTANKLNTWNASMYYYK